MKLILYTNRFFLESDLSMIEKSVHFEFGEPSMPPQPVYVKFNRQGKSLPDADACTGTISLPLDHKTKEEFTTSFKFSAQRLWKMLISFSLE